MSMQRDSFYCASSRVWSSVVTGSDLPGGAIVIVSPSISSTISGWPDELVMPTGLAALLWIPMSAP
jgi:hypothetical protein